ncbi:MAG: hypothetical protein AAF500_01505 [Myxococcota bacterium]
MRETRRFALASVFSAALLSLTATPAAHAQEDPGAEAGVFEGSSVESSAPGEDLDRKIRALRWGVALSTVSIPLGMGLFLGGAAACFGTGIFGDSCTGGENAMISLGIVFMIAGTAGMITSAILLRRRKQERRGLHASRRLRWSYESGAFVF